MRGHTGAGMGGRVIRRGNLRRQPTALEQRALEVVRSSPAGIAPVALGIKLGTTRNRAWTLAADLIEHFDVVEHEGFLYAARARKGAMPGPRAGNARALTLESDQPQHDRSTPGGQGDSPLLPAK